MFRRLPVLMCVMAVVGVHAFLSPWAFADDSNAGEAKPPVVGDTAPDFTLSTLDGNEVTLSELTKEGPVVVAVIRGWVGYQCPVCTRQVGDLIANGKKLADKQARVVLIYPGPADGLDAHAKEFIGKMEFPEGFSFVTDPDLSFVNAWNLRWDEENETAYPSTFVVDKDGKITFAKVSKTHGGRASGKEVMEALGG